VRNLKLPFSKFTSSVAKVIAKAAVIPICLVATPIVDLLLLPGLIKDMGKLMGVIAYLAANVIVFKACLGAGFEVIDNLFPGYKVGLVNEFKDKSLKEVVSARQIFKDVFMRRG